MCGLDVAVASTSRSVSGFIVPFVYNSGAKNKFLAKKSKYGSPKIRRFPVLNAFDALYPVLLRTTNYNCYSLCTT